MWGFLLFQSSVKSPFDPFIKGEKLNYIKMILFPNTIQFLLTYGLSKLWETKKNLLKLSSKRLIIQLIHIKQYVVYLLATQSPSVYSSEGRWGSIQASVSGKTHGDEAWEGHQRWQGTTFKAWTQKSEGTEAKHICCCQGPPDRIKELRLQKYGRLVTAQSENQIGIFRF